MMPIQVLKKSRHNEDLLTFDRDMPGQAQNLVNKLRADSNINFEQEWKMITLFIGGNNLCAFCDDLVSQCQGQILVNSCH